LGGKRENKPKKNYKQQCDFLHIPGKNVNEICKPCVCFNRCLCA